MGFMVYSLEIMKSQIYSAKKELVLKKTLILKILIG